MSGNTERNHEQFRQGKLFINSKIIFVLSKLNLINLLCRHVLGFFNSK
jgi:hypothetical protein